MRRVGSGTGGLCRKAPFDTRRLAFLRGDGCKTTALRFADVLEPAVGEDVTAATMRTLLRDLAAFFPDCTTAALIELRESALQSVELGCDGIE
jgi:hypothetical protein